MGRIFWMTLFVTATLAGCAEDPGSATDDQPPVAVTDTTGGIRGVVVDSGIVPIADATVRLLSEDASTVTDEDGSFTFGELQPGTYFVQASHPFYDTQQSSVDVVAGEENPPVVKIQLNRLINAEPYMETQQFEGYIACSANIVIALSEECGEGVGVPEDVPVVGGQRVGGNPANNAQIDFFVDNDLVRSLIAEAVWEPSITVGGGGAQSGGFNMGIYIDWSCLPVCNAAGGTVDRKDGVSPLYLRNDEALAGLDVDETTAFSTFTWAASDETGVLLEQPFEVFITSSYALPLPEEWSFVAGDDNPFS